MASILLRTACTRSFYVGLGLLIILASIEAYSQPTCQDTSGSSGITNGLAHVGGLTGCPGQTLSIRIQGTGVQPDTTCAPPSNGTIDHFYVYVLQSFWDDKGNPPGPCGGTICVGYQLLWSYNRNVNPPRWERVSSVVDASGNFDITFTSTTSNTCLTACADVYTGSYSSSSGFGCNQLSNRCFNSGSISSTVTCL